MTEALINTVEETENGCAADNITVAEIVEINRDGNVFIDFPGNNQGPRQAYFTHAFKTQMDQSIPLIGQKVLLVFNENDLELPVIIDTLHSRIDERPTTQKSNEDCPPVDGVALNGKKIYFNAENEIILQCGKASIQLTKNGRIIIRGAYLLNRSSGVNRIVGGSVQIN